MSLKTVFLSSTVEDLQDYRDAVSAAITEMDDYRCIHMETFGARRWKSAEFCCDKVRACDVFIGLIGHLYGSCPDGQEISYTELEYKTAQEAGKPILLFLASDEFPLPVKLREPDISWLRQQRFRKEVSSQCVGFFDQPSVLGAQVVIALRNLEHESRARGRSVVPSRVKADFERAAERYLTHLADHRYLDLRGMGVSVSRSLGLPLLDMYVPLMARIELATDRGKGPAVTVPGVQLKQPQPVFDLLCQHQGLVVLGEAGTGKTMFLQYLVLSLAIGSPDTRGLMTRLPVLVSLPAYAKRLAKRETSLLRFVDSQYRELGMKLPLEGMLQQALEKGELLWLLDGLDQVRDQDLRADVMDYVANFNSLHRQQGNKLVLTSRSLEYWKARVPMEGVVECSLAELEEADILAFLDRWVRFLEKSEGADGEALKRRYAKVQSKNARLLPLASNPLRMTILALLWSQGLSLPQRRVELFKSYIETSMFHWNASRNALARTRRHRGSSEPLAVLASLALWIHEQPGSESLVTEEDLLRHLEMLLSERGSKNPRNAAEELLEYFRRTALLVERGDRQLGFVHAIFQEYLAAVALGQRIESGADAVAEAIVQRSGEAHWQDVIVLLVGFLAVLQHRSEPAAAVLLQVMAGAPGDSGGRVVLAGRALAEAGVENLPERCRAQVVEALLRTLGDVDGTPLHTRAGAGQALGLVGDPRREVVACDQMELCWVSAGPFWMGSFDDDGAAEAIEKKIHLCELPYDYWLGRYPVTVGQFKEYLESSKERFAYPDYLERPANQPMVRVSWYEARKFCEWLTVRWRQLGRLGSHGMVNLPSEAEWEKAARGGLKIPRYPIVAHGVRGQAPAPSLKRNLSSRRLYPWGDHQEFHLANCREANVNEPSAIGCFPGGVSPYGCEELSGNVWEWTRSIWGELAATPKFSYPYLHTDDRESLRAGSHVLRVLRGGSFGEPEHRARCAARMRENPVDGYQDVGFRVVLMHSERF